MNTFSACEVVAQIQGLHTVKTLHRWQKAVEENFGITYFQQNHPNNSSNTIRYSLDEVKRFQMVALILSGQPSNRKNLQQAIVTAFSSDKPLIAKKTEVEVLEDTFCRKMDDLSKENQRLWNANMEINRKLAFIEKQLLEEKDSKPKLFRRK